jgi:hypothetical protein
MKTLPYYPTVSWGNRRNERLSSKIHYDRGDGKTLCGKTIPETDNSGDAWDMCERCVNIQNAKGEAK